MKKHFFAVLVLFCFFLLGAAEIDWSKAEEVREGVKLLKLQTDTPRLLKINLMRIDLGNPKLRFTGTARDPDWGNPMPDHTKTLIRTRRTRTRDFLAHAARPVEQGGLGLNMIVAANSAPWWPWESPYNHRYAHPSGLAILNGEVVCDTRPHRAVFVVYKDRKAKIATSVPESDYKNIQLAASGFAIILKDGNIPAEANAPNGLHPRIAYGLSAQRDYLYLITIDGRQPAWSLGATGRETAQFLKDAGASDAINMDGGGSTTLCYRDKAGKIVTVNRHTASGYTRTVGSNIGIYLEP